MELRQLRHLLMILEKGSINRAASSLNISQPSLSNSIKMLERSLGAELLIRGGSGVSLTEIGREFTKYAKVIVRESEKAFSEVTAMRGSGQGRITVGVQSGLNFGFASHVSSQFITQVKTVSLDLVTSSYTLAQVTRYLQTAEWDLAVTLLLTDLDTESALPGIVVERIAPISSRVYCRPLHPLAKRGKATSEDLAHCEWASTKSGNVEARLRAAFESTGAEPALRFRTDSMELLSTLVEGHDLLCLLPAVTAAEAVQAGRLVELKQDIFAIEASICLLHPEITERTPPIRKLMSLFRERAREMLS